MLIVIFKLFFFSKSIINGVDKHGRRTINRFILFDFELSLNEVVQLGQTILFSFEINSKKKAFRLK